MPIEVMSCPLFTLVPSHGVMLFLEGLIGSKYWLQVSMTTAVAILECGIEMSHGRQSGYGNRLTV